MGQQRQLLLGSVGRQYYARISAQRKKYCVWALAVVVPFLVLFCLFPSGSSFYRPSYKHIVVSQLQISASKPRSGHGRTEKLNSKMDQPLLGHTQNEESIKSSKSTTGLADRQSKIKHPIRDDNDRKSKIKHQIRDTDRLIEQELDQQLGQPSTQFRKKDPHPRKETHTKGEANALPEKIPENISFFGKRVADQTLASSSTPSRRKPTVIDDEEEDHSSFGKEIKGKENPIKRSKQSSEGNGVMESEESMPADLDEGGADRRPSSKISDKLDQMDDLEEEISSNIGKRDGDRSSISSEISHKQEDEDAAELLFWEGQDKPKLDKKGLQKKKKKGHRSNDVGIELSDLSSDDSDEDAMIFSEWSPDSRSTATHKKARKSSLPQQEDEDDLSDWALQSRVISKTEPINIRKKAPVQCKLSQGKWIRGTKGTLYTNATCPSISYDQQICKLIKKNWRWKPNGCELKRFEAKAFLKLMQRKSLAFVGDKLAKTQMQSLLCLLAQVERPKLLYDDKANQSMSWHLSSSNFTLSMVWSPYLVQGTAEKGYKKLRLDQLDTKWAELVPKLDVLVMGVGSLFIEPAAYVVKGEVVGCHACQNIDSIDSKTTKEMSLYSGYRAAMRSSIMGVAAMPGFKGVTVFLQAYGFEGKRYQNVSMKMKEIQEEELQKAWERGIPNGSKMELLETALQSNHLISSSSRSSSSISAVNPMQGPEASSYGCLPGLSDTWNQFLQHILNRLYS